MSEPPRSPSREDALAWIREGDWHVCEYRQVGGDMKIVKHGSYDCLRELQRRPGWVHFVGLSLRPGTALFARLLELTYFPPGSARNGDFELRNVRWGEMPWDLCSIPARCRRFADRVADRVRLRIADGVPGLLEGGDPAPRLFPMARSNVFHLEYGPTFPAEALNLPGGLDALRAAEDRSIEQLEKRYFGHPRRN